MQGLSSNIVNSLQRVERIMATHQEEMAMATDLQEPLNQLEMYVLGHYTESIESPLAY